MRINKQRNYNSVPKRIFRKVLIILLIVGIPAMLFLFTFGIKKVDIVGSNRYSDKQMKEMVLKTRLDYNSVYLYLKYHYFETPDIPFIEKLDVEITDNHKITIYVYEKAVIGCVEFMGEYLYFDKDGIVVESSSKKIKDIPVIDGLQFNEIVLHKKLNVLNNDTEQSRASEQIKATEQGKAGEQGKASEQSKDNELNKASEQSEESKKNDELFKVILNLAQLINKYKLNVDTISFNKSNEVTLKCGDIRVLLGNKSNYDEALSDLKNILAKTKGTDLYELDMSDYNKDSSYIIGKPKNSTE